MVRNIRDTWEKVREKSHWSYPAIVLVIAFGYEPTRDSFIAQEPSVWITESTLSVNMILLFAAWGASCPIIAKRLKKPRWFGYILLAPVLLILIFLISLFGAETRW